jgi:hypothetical protein
MAFYARPAPQGVFMRKHITVLAFLFLGALICLADQQAMRATIISQSSVSCGTKKQSKKETTDIMCQQYTVRTPTTEYQIRQQKPGNMEILQPNTPIEFTLDKNKMKFKANGKKYEFLVVGSSAINAQKP